MSLELKFQSACDQVRKFAKKPPDADMLEVYSLYKQATVGDVNITVKTMDPVAVAKFEAWTKKKGMKQEAAKEAYILKVKALAPAYEN